MTLNSATDLTQGPVGSHLTRMTIPMTWGLMSVMAVQLVDAYFVGQLGTDSLAAVGFAFPIMGLFTAFAFGIGAGASSVIARAIGGGRHDMVRAYSTQSVLLGIVFAVCFATLGLQTIDPLFLALGADPEVLPLIHDYLGWWYWGCPLVVVAMVGNAGIRASGNIRTPAMIMTVAAVGNLILDPILIFGLLGFPRMELAGAALATVIAFFVTMLCALYVLKVRLKMISLSACTFKVGQSWKDILHVAIPASTTNLIEPMAVAIATWMVAGFGTVAVAGFGVATRIENMCLFVVMSLAIIMGPFVGQNAGAGRPERVEKAVNLAYRFSIGFGIAIAVLMWVGGAWLTALFNDDPQMLAVATTYLYLVPISYTLLGVIMVASAVANGIGSPGPALVMSFTQLLVVFVPAAWLLSQQVGVTGIFIAAALANTVVGLGAMVWSRKRCAAMAVDRSAEPVPD